MVDSLVPLSSGTSKSYLFCPPALRWPVTPGERRLGIGCGLLKEECHPTRMNTMAASDGASNLKPALRMSMDGESGSQINSSSKGQCLIPLSVLLSFFIMRPMSSPRNSSGICGCRVSGPTWNCTSMPPCSSALRCLAMLVLVLRGLCSPLRPSYMHSYRARGYGPSRVT